MPKRQLNMHGIKINGDELNERENKCLYFLKKERAKKYNRPNAGF